MGWSCRSTSAPGATIISRSTVALAVTWAPTSPPPASLPTICRRCSINFGNEAGLSIILFNLDETTYSRELAPLAGHYPVLKLGPPWWFYDSINGIERYFDNVVETAGHLQHDRLQRRHARLPVDPGAPRSVATGRLPTGSPVLRCAVLSTGRTRWPWCERCRMTWRRNRIGWKSRVHTCDSKTD